MGSLATKPAKHLDGAEQPISGRGRPTRNRGRIVPAIDRRLQITPGKGPCDKLAPIHGGTGEPAFRAGIERFDIEPGTDSDPGVGLGASRRRAPGGTSIMARLIVFQFASGPVIGSNASQMTASLGGFVTDLPPRERRELVLVLNGVHDIQSAGCFTNVRPRMVAQGVAEGGSATTPSGSEPFQSGPIIA